MNSLATFLPDFMHFNAIESTNLILMLGLIMFLGALGGRLFQKLKIPQVVGYIVIGILIGQSGFQILSSKVIASLNPLSEMALALIGFLIGSELKINVIKKYGKQFVGILLFEAIVPFFVVSIVVTCATYLFTKNLTTSVSLGLILGAISSATAPAATTDVLRENRTRGPLTTTVLGIVAMDDAVALILYAIASSIASNLLGETSVSFGRQLLNLAYDIVVSCAIGGFSGFLLGKFIRNCMTNEGRILSFSLGALLLCTGACAILKLDTILAAMAMGFSMVNFAPIKTRPTFALVEKFTPPIYVLFFVLVGAKLNIWNVTAFVGIIALLYIICRTIGKSLGSIIGAKITKAPDSVRKYMPFCLLSQAGVAIGLSIAAGKDFSMTIGPTVMLIITATTFVVQLLGPVCVKYGVTKAGECGLDITEEDIMQKLCVKDVVLGKEHKPIARIDSPAIVKETDSLASILESFSHLPNNNYVVTDSTGKLTGIINLEHLKECLLFREFSDGLMATDIAEPAKTTCTIDTSLPDLMKKFAQSDTDAIPVIDENGKSLGIMEQHAVDHFLHKQVIELHKKIANLG